MNRLVRHLLASISRAYGVLATRAGERKYTQRIRFPLPIVSVGGITVGGSGKTPLVRLVAEEVIGRGFVPLIVSRGYRRSEREHLVLPPSDARRHDPTLVGDEPAMLAGFLPDAWLLIGPDRTANLSAFLDVAPNETIANAIAILDDGFQHRRVARDLDIVAIDRTVPETPRTLPAGRLREPLENLGRADLVVALEEEVFSAIERDHPTVFRSIDGRMRTVAEVVLPPPIDRVGKILLVTAIARPERVRRSVESLGLTITGHLRYRDHHRFSRSDIGEIDRHRSNDRAELIVVTAKDFVKLRNEPILAPYLHPIDFRLVSEVPLLPETIFSEREPTRLNPDSI